MALSGSGKKGTPCTRAPFFSQSKHNMSKNSSGFAAINTNRELPRAPKCGGKSISLEKGGCNEKSLQTRTSNSNALERSPTNPKILYPAALRLCISNFTLSQPKMTKLTTNPVARLRAPRPSCRALGSPRRCAYTCY